jgi:hypothetical protein
MLTSMKDIKLISGKLCQLLVRLATLIIQLSRQLVFPNRKRKGNLLNTLFLFYIGAITSIQHFEHNQFKIADLFRNRLVRSGLMLCGFLLFFLASYEQPFSVQTGLNQSATAEYSGQTQAIKLFGTDAKEVLTEIRFAHTYLPRLSHVAHLGYLPDGYQRYLQVRRLLI